MFESIPGMPPTESDPRIPAHRERLGALTFHELTAGLAWPLLTRALGQSVRASHLLIGFMISLVVFGGGWLLDRAWVKLFLDGRETEGMVSPFASLGAIWPTGGARQLESRLQATLGFGGAAGWTSIFALLLFLPVMAIGLGAIGRSTALDIASKRSMSTMDAVRFALARARALIVSALAPVLIVAALIGLIYLVRLAFFEIGFMRPIGATLFVVPLLIGLFAAMLGALIVFGHGMLAPAVVIENTDGVDAIQRSWGYLVSRPIRFALYLLVIVVVLFFAYGVVQEVFRAGIGFAHRSLPAEMREKMRFEGGYSASSITFWVQMIWLVFIGWVVSFYGCASTIVYLLMRLACDEQDVTFIWLRSDVQTPVVPVAEPSEVAKDLEF